MLYKASADRRFRTGVKRRGAISTATLFAWETSYGPQSYTYNHNDSRLAGVMVRTVSSLRAASSECTDFPVFLGATGIAVLVPLLPGKSAATHQSFDAIVEAGATPEREYVGQRKIRFGIAGTARRVALPQRGELLTVTRG